MKKQHYESINAIILEKFQKLRSEHPERLQRRLNLSWSNWGFGLEDLNTSLRRLNGAGVKFIELHGNHYGTDLGYRADDTIKLLEHYDIAVSGICGMFSADNDLSSNRAIHRQAAIDYIRREVDFGAAVKAEYLLIVPGAVGRPLAYDTSEFERSVESLRLVADIFVEKNIQAAIEPIRADEVSIVHSISEAKAYIDAVGHPGVRHINGDVYHMQASESHIGQALLNAGDALVNLHVADSNRGVLGGGSIDLDTIIRSLYLIGHNRAGRYVTPEPLGPGGNPYPAMYGRTSEDTLDDLVKNTVSYFRERENIILEH